MAQVLNIADTCLAGVKVISTHAHVDERGAFSRWFCWQTLAAVLPAGQQIRQINHSLNLHAGTVRGMHFQHQAEGDCAAGEYKLVRCLRGKVQDVVLDLRRYSSTFGRHLSLELSEANQHMLLIPPGCAHGFQALEDNSQLLYLHTQDYQPALDAGVHVSDPQFAIQWPLAIQHLSARDQAFAFFSAATQSAPL